MLDALLDRSIVFSFDKSGFRRHSRDFDPADLDVDLAGKLICVTGANSGIGRATSKALAERGATLRLLCRNEERGTEARDALRRETGNPDIHLDLVDVADFASLRRVCEGLEQELGDRPIDVLVHNAGALPSERIETADGNELCLAVNLLGPYLMTSLLLPRLRAADQGRIIFVASGGMYGARLETKDPQYVRGDYDGVQAYARAKRGQVVLTELLAERLAGTAITVNSMHPGWADTPAVKSSIPTFHKVTKRILRSPEQGADTVIWLAACERIADRSGLFWFDREEADTHLMKRTRESAEERRIFRDFLCERCGVDWDRLI